MDYGSEQDSPELAAFCASLRENFELCMYFSVVEDLFGTKPVPSTGRMKSSLWRLMPEELVERVLLFLPASSQARFCIVCKRWRELMRSSAFRDESALIAFCSRDSICICSPGEPCDMLGERSANVKPMKVHKYDLGMVPPELRQYDNCGQFFTHGGLLGMAVETDKPKGVRICVFNPANRTWRELPRMVFDHAPFDWTISMVAYKQKGLTYQVFLAWTHMLRHGGTVRLRTRFNVFSSTTDAWSTGVLQPCDKVTRDIPDAVVLSDYVVSKGGFVYAKASHFLDSDEDRKEVLRITLDGKYLSTVRHPPDGDLGLETQSCHLDASYHGETLFWVRNTCSIFKCGKRSRKWKLVSRVPKELRDKMELSSFSKCELVSAQVVGNLILLVCTSRQKLGGNGKYIMAYHILEDTWNLVCRVSHFWECHWFLASRPELLVGK